MSGQRVLVVGGGLAGLAAACELLERGCSVTILEKTASLGGNSSKATCGIAAPGSAVQKAAGVQDSGTDMLGDGPVAEALVKTGAQDVEWLTKAIGVGSELVLRRTPGHAVARTIGTKTHFPGAVVTYAAIHVLQQVSQVKPERLEIITGAEVQKLLSDGTKVTGLEYTRGGSAVQLSGPVVLATGGYAGDYSQGGVLAQSAPTALRYPTTNDERASGDGLKLGKQVKAGITGLGKVSLMPLAAVMPGREQEAFKVVISEAICGAGGKMINADGARFCDEMATADVRAEAMAKSKPPFRVVIGSKEAEPVKWLVDFYTNRNVMKKYNSVSALAKEIGVQAGALSSLGLGSAEVFAGVVTPALYSCVGGLRTGAPGGPQSGQALAATGQPVEGLFAAGEATDPSLPRLWSVSGVPLLYCVVSGRAAGRAAAALARGGGKEEVTDLRDIIIGSLTAPKNLPAPALEAAAAGEKKVEDMSKEELIQKIKALQADGAVAAAAPKDDGPKGVTLEDVKKHNKKDDAWIVVNGSVIDVTKWIPIHPGGEQAIVAYLGQDSSEEWNMIHKPGTVEKYLVPPGGNGPVLIGPLSAGGGAVAAAGKAAPAAAGGGGLTLDDVAKHNKESDCWVVVNGRAYDVTKWIPVHPGGVQAIMAYAGKDSTDEWNMIHKPGTVEKNLFPGNPNGPVDKGPCAGGSAAAPPPPGGAVDDDKPPPDGYGKIKGPLGAVVYLLINVVTLLMKTVFFTGNFKVSFDNNRKGTIRSAIFLITFVIVHALGNFVDMIGGPNELNGEGYLFDRIHWTGAFGYLPDFPFSVVEEYLALGLLLHVAVALKRSWDISMNYCVYTGRWNMLLSGLTILFFLTQHLRDFRFYQGFKFTLLRVPKHLVAFDGLLEGRVFYETDPSIAPTKVRDIYSHEVELFKDLGTVLLYTACVVVFVMHLCMGWKKLVPADMMQIPKDHVKTVTWLGWLAAAAVAGMYVSVPWYVYYTPAVVVEQIAA